MIVEDHPLVRDALRILFESDEGFAVCAEACDEPGAVRLASATRPDVVVVDFHIRGCATSATRRILGVSPGTRVLLLTALDDDAALLACLVAGAAGYLLTQLRGPDLAGAVRAAARGENLLDR